jgi:uncharacterized protein YggE
MVGLVGCASGAAAPAEIGELNLVSQQGIWVSGQGKATAVPDIVTLSLGIEAEEESVAEAQLQAAEAMDDVMNALRDNGVAGKDIQTQRFSIFQVTRWNNLEQKQEVVGYRVVNLVTAKIRDIDKAGTIIDAVAEAGGDLTRINNISFSVDDPTPYREEAREEAMAEAKAKATQLADLAGVTLGRPTYISEGGGAPPPVPVFRDFAIAEAGAAVETPISPGEVELTVTVQVAYDIR